MSFQPLRPGRPRKPPGSASSRCVRPYGPSLRRRPLAPRTGTGPAARGCGAPMPGMDPLPRRRQAPRILTLVCRQAALHDRYLADAPAIPSHPSQPGGCARYRATSLGTGRRPGARRAASGLRTPDPAMPPALGADAGLWGEGVGAPGAVDLLHRPSQTGADRLIRHSVPEAMEIPPCRTEG